MKSHIVYIACIAALVTATSCAAADPIRVEVSGIGTGTLNGSSFSNATFLIFGLGDTSNVEQPLPDIFRIIPESSGVSVNGGGTSLFDDEIQIAVNQSQPADQSNPAAGFGNITQGRSLAFVASDQFGDYFLDNSIGPISGPSKESFSFGVAHSTQEGSFELTSVSSIEFRAVVVAVPEPSACSFLLAYWAFCTSRRKRHV